jgi:alpha-1,3-glucan synthase
MSVTALRLLSVACVLLSTIHAMQYNPDYVQWNLNTAVDATDPLDYVGLWENHIFNPSPDNWRFPFYTVMLDRFVNGDPTNDNANGTVFEYDLNETQLRHGGDIRGLKDSLDYLQGMGIKVNTLLYWIDFREFTVLEQFS